MITSFRMYNAVPRAAAAWRALFDRVFADAGVSIEVIEHKWPQPIADLWQREDLCCAFMCGWPFARAGTMQAIAAPVPSPPRYAGQPRYRSELLVREESGWRSIEETFGHRIGWMAEDSQSGFNAPRAYLARFASAQRPRLYCESRGPLGSPMKTLEALRADEIDVTALDGYFLDLVRHHDPAKLAGIRTVATTPWTPIPLLVAAPAIDASVVERLRHRLTGLHEDPSCRGLLEPVLLSRFAPPDAAAYAALESLARFAVQGGYGTIR